MKGKHETNSIQGSKTNSNASDAPLKPKDLFDEGQPNHEQANIAKWLEKLHFQKQFLGGVSEESVWKKIGELNAMYEAALKAERIRYDTLIEYYNKTPEKIEADDISMDMQVREKVDDE